TFLHSPGGQEPPPTLHFLSPWGWPGRPEAIKDACSPPERHFSTGSRPGRHCLIQYMIKRLAPGAGSPALDYAPALVLTHAIKARFPRTSRALTSNPESARILKFSCKVRGESPCSTRYC